VPFWVAPDSSRYAPTLLATSKPQRILLLEGDICGDKDVAAADATDSSFTFALACSACRDGGIDVAAVTVPLELSITPDATQVRF
jgi:hypothetical protein